MFSKALQQKIIDTYLEADAFEACMTSVVQVSDFVVRNVKFSKELKITMSTIHKSVRAATVASDHPHYNALSERFDEAVDIVNYEAVSSDHPDLLKYYVINNYCYHYWMLQLNGRERGKGFKVKNGSLPEDVGACILGIFNGLAQSGLVDESKFKLYVDEFVKQYQQEPPIVKFDEQKYQALLNDAQNK
jgi:hypothetical protein